MWELIQIQEQLMIVEERCSKYFTSCIQYKYTQHAYTSNKEKKLFFTDVQGDTVYEMKYIGHTHKTYT